MCRGVSNKHCLLPFFILDLVGNPKTNLLMIWFYKSVISTVFQHFVSDRKIDEDLGRTTRFCYDDDHLKDVSNTL